ncbi:MULTISPECIES: YhgE/Pip domain-containing protein [Clostridia]|uniref:Phage infection protein n=1 Tax=Lacrimispora celerecrescens TaxID=29354 RepID=A0A084JNG3_9FIRM|nr:MULTISPECIES: YhgE/Pip domain-containing protein [Clostridia]KEZ90497.1 phage infection protein [Lacrimispora celerecrescens]MSS11059.1 YhgE/Pip domain-containing protein [Clostridium sp. WB02_MRS01]
MVHVKNIFKIFTGDIKRIAFNPVAVIIALGLTLIPALYAWFNIAASWDPYANTKGLKVAVVNLDKGASIDDIFDTDIDDSSINIGEMILDELRKNEQIGWQFVNKEVAIDGVESGKYYAAVIVPEDFSQKISSVLTSSIERPVLEYYVNEKKNAIATKITGKGVESVQQQINETFINSTSKVAGKALNKYSDNWSTDKETDRDDAVSTLTEVKTDLNQLVDTITMLQSTLRTVNSLNGGMKGTLPDVNKMIESGGQTAESAKTLIDSSRGFSDTMTGGIKDTLDHINQVEESVYESFQVIGKLTDTSADGALDALKATENLVTGSINQCNSVNKVLGAINQKLPIPLKDITTLQQKLSDTVKQQQDLVRKLQSAQQTVKQTKRLPDTMEKDIGDTLDGVTNSISDVLNFYTGKVELPLKDSLDKTYDALGTTAGALDSIGSMVGQIDTTLDSVTASSQSLIEALDSAVSLMNRSQERVDDMIDNVNKLADNKKLNKIMDIMKNDPDQLSDFMKMPTDMVTNKVYPVDNYGSAMAPFYTILAIWVGGLILVALVKTKVEANRSEGLKLYETYFGRYLTFMMFGIAQALVVSLGDLYMLKIQCLYPGKFVLAAVAASIIFTNIIYSMTVSFGDVGKAIVVVFMVIQVAGSGGTFPIQVTPRFFQMVNPLLPFTHLINAMRECVGGIYGNDYWKDIRNVMVYIPISLLVGIVLRKKVLKLNEFFEEKLSQTGIM